MVASKELLKIKTIFQPGAVKIYEDAQIKKAWVEVQKEGFKSNPKVRNTIVKEFSDYISRFEPFKDEPVKASDKYENPKSLPDTEIEINDFIKIAGKEVALAMEQGGATTTSRVTAEIKQHAGKGGAATTLTGKTVAGANLESFKKEFPKLMSQSWNEESQPKLHAWLDANPKGAFENQEGYQLRIKYNSIKKNFNRSLISIG